MNTPISKKMLINVMHPEETRVAIVHDGRLMELNIEISGKEQIKGNIYKGVVLRVEERTSQQLGPGLRFVPERLAGGARSRRRRGSHLTARKQPEREDTAE